MRQITDRQRDQRVIYYVEEGGEFTPPTPHRARQQRRSVPWGRLVLAPLLFGFLGLLLLVMVAPAPLLAHLVDRAIVVLALLIVGGFFVALFVGMIGVMLGGGR
jgi:hypothetical protein